MKSLSRREFIKATAASTAAAAIGVTLLPGMENTLFAGTTEWHKSVCRYCGVGCGVMVGVRDGKIIAVKGDKECPTNFGLLCVKAFYLNRINYAKTRLTHPLIKKNGKFEKASWDEAMDLIAQKFKKSINENGPDSVAFYGSGQAFTEETYIANKLFKGCIGTNNVEGNPRLCMASAVGGYLTTFGGDEPSGSYTDIDQCDCFLLIGSNTAEAHPVIFERIAKRKANNPNVKIIIIDPRKTPTDKIADLHLHCIPGYDLPILHAMARLLIKNGHTDEEFIKNHVAFNDGKNPITYEQYKEFIEEFTPENAAKTCGVTAEEIIEATKLFGEAKTAMSMWTMGINQRTRGVWANNLIHNLHLLTGKIGVPGSDSFSLTGQPNACGGVREGGGLCHLLPGHRLVAKPAHRAAVAKVWKISPDKIAPKPGYHTVAMFDALAKGDVKCIWICTTNPAQSLPNLNKYLKGMEEQFMVVAEAYHPTMTSELADVVLPVSMWSEKEGIYGCTERRSQHLSKCVDPPGEAKWDGEALMMLARRLGYGDKFPFKGPEDAWNEYRTLTKGTDMDLTGMPYSRLKKVRGLQWPCPSVDHPGTEKRFVKGDPLFKGDGRINFYKKPNGRAIIFARPAKGPEEPTDAEYPFALTTGRILEHWHTGTMTMTVPELNRAVPKPYVEIHPADAKNMGIANKDMIEIISRRGAVKMEARVIDRPRKGTLFVPWHWREALINLVTTDAVDPGSKEPEYKVCAVKMKKA